MLVPSPRSRGSPGDWWSVVPGDGRTPWGASRFVWRKPIGPFRDSLVGNTYGRGPPVGGVQVAGRATGLEDLDGDISPSLRTGRSCVSGCGCIPRVCVMVPRLAGSVGPS